MSKALSRFVPVTIMLVFILLIWVALDTRKPPPPSVNSFNNWQSSDAGYGYWIERDGGLMLQKFHPQFNFLNAFEHSLIPENINGMKSPLGTESLGFVYNAQSFSEFNKRRGGRHTGDDLNGIGGMDSDYGDPVYSIANGLVLYSGVLSKGWGKTLILAHRFEGGKVLHSMYTHLSELYVTCGSIVGVGEEIASVGNAQGFYLSHLHFEMRYAEGISPQNGYTRFMFDRVNPIEELKKSKGFGTLSVSSGIERAVFKNFESGELPQMDSNSALRYIEFMKEPF